MHMASTFAHLTGFLYGARRTTRIGDENIPLAYIQNVLYEHPDPAAMCIGVGQGIAVMLGTT
jgi:hypothetical protein